MPYSKKTARTTARTLLSSLNGMRREQAAMKACTNLTSSLYWKEAKNLLIYLAFGSELDTDPVIQMALDDGKYVFAPRVYENKMMFHRVKSLNGPFEKGFLGIREPLLSSTEWNESFSSGPTLILVPGLAFDKSGARLGRGGGYYDRFLSIIRKKIRAPGKKPPLCIGFAYQELIVENIPVEENDEMVDGLVTDDFSLRFQSLPPCSCLP